MASITSILTVRDAVVGRILASADNRVALCSPARVGFGGKPIKGETAIGYVFTSDMCIETDKELKELAASWNASGLRKAVGPNPSAIIAWTDGAESRVFLYACHTDESGEHKVHRLMLDATRTASIGSIVVTVREILADGSFGPVTEQPSDRQPGSPPKVDLPAGAPDWDVLRMALTNMVQTLATSHPTDRQLEEWSLAHSTDAGETRMSPVISVAAPASRAPRPAAPVDRLRVDLGKLAARVEPLRRPVFVPVMRPAEAGDSDGSSGRIGRTFIPAGTEWPTVKGVTLHPIVQLDVASLPQEARDLLGGGGLFQFFCGPDYDEGNETWLARVVAPRTAGSLQAMPGEEEGAPRVVITGWEERTEAPCQTEFGEGPPALTGGRRLSETMLEALEILAPETFGQSRLPADRVAASALENGLDPQEAETVAELLTHHDGNKLLGWPTWSQAPEWQGGKRNPMRLLFQFALGDDGALNLATDVLAGDGTAQVFVSTDGELRFGFAWACG